MELGVGRVGAILGPYAAGALQQFYGAPTAMLLAIGGAVLLAVAFVLCARQPRWAGASPMLVSADRT